MQIQHSTESNTTALGGALYNGANLYIENTAFYKNHTNGFTAHGGAIQNAGNLTIVSSIFDGNYSEGALRTAQTHAAAQFTTQAI